MYNASDKGPVPEEYGMGEGVGRRTQFAFHHFPVEIDDDDHVGLECVVGYAAGFDGEDSFLMICHADISECEEYQPEFWEFEVGMTGFFL